MLPPVLVLASVAIGLVPAATGLAAARWPYRSPAAAIVLWQAMGLGWGLAAIGTLAALGTDRGESGVAGDALAVLARAVHDVVGEAAPPGLMAALRLLCLAASTALLALLCWVLVAASGAVLRDRRRHRALLSLLAHGDPKVPGALVVDHPAAAAYCVPGLRSRIVVSAGALDLLDQAELAAVLAHERAHARERHDLVLLPFTALCRAFPWSGSAQRAYATVALLIEMLADDHALRHRPARELVTALIRVGAAGRRHPSGSAGRGRPPGHRRPPASAPPARHQPPARHRSPAGRERGVRPGGAPAGPGAGTLAAGPGPGQRGRRGPGRGPGRAAAVPGVGTGPGRDTGPRFRRVYAQFTGNFRSTYRAGSWPARYRILRSSPRRWIPRRWIPRRWNRHRWPPLLRRWPRPWRRAPGRPGRPDPT